MKRVQGVQGSRGRMLLIILDLILTSLSRIELNSLEDDLFIIRECL